MKSYCIPILRNFLVKFPAVRRLLINFLIVSFIMHPNTHLPVPYAKNHFLRPICLVFISQKTMTPFSTYYRKRGHLMSAYLKHVQMLTVVGQRYVIQSNRFCSVLSLNLRALLIILVSLIDFISVLDCRRAKTTLH